MDLTGIENENGYFPESYIVGALEEDLAEPLRLWAAAEGRISPVNALSGLANDYAGKLGRLRSRTDREVARELQARMTHDLLSALGYSPIRESRESSERALIPTLGRIADENGRDRLWIVEAPLHDKGDEAADPLGSTFTRGQFDDVDEGEAETKRPIEEILGRGIFDLDHPPRYVLLAGSAQLLLVDRNRWASRSVLRFDLQEIFSRANKDTLSAMACFLARDALVPLIGIPLAERLQEEAQRHANAVTASLKATVREAIELLGEEVLAVNRRQVPDRPAQGALDPRRGSFARMSALHVSPAVSPLRRGQPHGLASSIRTTRSMPAATVSKRSAN